MYTEEYRWQTHPRPWNGYQQNQWPQQPQMYTHQPYTEYGGYFQQQPQSIPYYQQQNHQGYQQPHYQQGFNGYGYQPQQSKLSGLLTPFQGKDGKFDFNKAFVTVDQVMKTANQISPLMKQVGSFFTNFTP
ncbi:YppG family protein [Alteribacter aurantiacus]|uniref:YppG family protein n=1 Tax=Alteribacter aurantiacus TaxID=254410 RepID=UPI000407F244|nr:YppG family protein [Alteribacter aurantiacus]